MLIRRKWRQQRFVSLHRKKKEYFLVTDWSPDLAGREEAVSSTVRGGATSSPRGLAGPPATGGSGGPGRPRSRAGRGPRPMGVRQRPARKPSWFRDTALRLRSRRAAARSAALKPPPHSRSLPPPSPAAVPLPTPPPPPSASPPPLL
jgi:hypothetical protein